MRSRIGVLALGGVLLGVSCGGSIELPSCPPGSTGTWPLCVVPAVPSPPTSPLPSASPPPSVPIPTPSPTTPSPVPSPAPTAPPATPTAPPPPFPPVCVTTTTQPGHGVIERRNGPWHSYSPARTVKDRMAGGATYERMYRVVLGEKHECDTPSEKIEWARRTRNWSCPVQPRYAGGQDFPHWGACGAYCQGNDDHPWCLDARANRVSADGTILNPADLDGYTGPTCPIALAEVVASTCPEETPGSPSSPPPAPPQSSPRPGSIPGTCPPLVRWGGGVHSSMTGSFQPLAKTDIRAGGYVTLDSTPRFGSGRGLPCNSDHHAVCETNGDDHGPLWRECEDPRGPEWTHVQGRSTKPAKPQGDGGYLLRVGLLGSGHHAYRVCPRPDVQDGLGQPVRVVGDTCTIIEWYVP